MTVRRLDLPILVVLFVCFSLFAGTSHSSEQQGEAVLADSVEDFSGVQGRHGWFYGYWDQSSDQDGVYDQAGDFTPLGRPALGQ